MKRSHVLGILLIVLSIVITACGGNGGAASTNDKGATNNGAEPTASSTTAPETEAKAETRTITTVMGDVEIPANPKKIVAAGYLGDLLALGIKPIGAPQFHMDNPFLKDLSAGIADIGNEISLEKTLALEPDLIMTSIDADYEQFSKIAPTVVILPGSVKTFTEELRVIADIVGKQQEAEAWITAFEERAAEARQQLSNVIGADETVGIYILTDKDFYVLGDGIGRGGQAIYNALQLKAPALVQSEILDKGEAYKQVSLEKLSDYAADHVFLSVELEEENQKTVNTLLDRKIWKGLTAVKNDQVYQIARDKFYHYDPISIKGQMDSIVELLLAHNK